MPKLTLKVGVRVVSKEAPIKYGNIKASIKKGF